MNTLRELIESRKCRSGKPSGTTKRGAYWLACEKITLRRCGGDGIGNSGSDVTFDLQLRHYRSGEVAAVVNRHSWHQNSGTSDRYQQWSSLLDCTTVEQVIVALKSHSFSDGDWSEAAYSDMKESAVTESLEAFGLAACEPAPDDVQPVEVE